MRRSNSSQFGVIWKLAFIFVFVLTQMGWIPALINRVQARPLFAPPVFTGDAAVDFAIAGVVSYVDSTSDVGVPASAPIGTISGWNFQRLYFYYDVATDTMYVGVDCVVICGDADGDGDPGSTSGWLSGEGGEDQPDLANSESFTLLLDGNNDYVNFSNTAGRFETAVGVSSSKGLGGNIFTDWGVYDFSTGLPGLPSLGYGALIPGHASSAASPSAGAPDLEFTIANFSTLPGFSFTPGEVFTFQTSLFAGSLEDDGIGEDYLPAQTSSIKVTIGKVDWQVTKTNNVGGSVAAGTPFNWLIDVSNAAGMDTATFASGEVIFRDNLPSGPTYGAVTVTPSGLSGTGSVACVIASNVLTCTASGGTVKFPGGGSFNATFSVTSASTGTLVNPTGGVCKVDPNSLFTETDETNNTCSNTVTILTQPNLTAVKTNNTGGTGVVGTPYNWTIQVSNAAGSSTASFPTVGQLIFRDVLPVGPTYGIGGVTMSGGTTNVTCGIISPVVECYSSGMATIPAGGSFSFNISVTPTASGSLVNPTGGVCRVDPNTLIAETNEGDNDCSNTVTVNPQPDLTAVKTNNVSGSLVLGGSYNWSIAVSNAAGTSTATFTSGQVIFRDNLPTSGATYGAVTVTPSGTTGTIACSIISNVLTCTASGGTVTIPSGASFTAAFGVTPTASGSLVNPSAGVCRVDPNTLISEGNEGNNDCSDTVTVNKASPTLSTTPGAGGGIGTTLTDTATLSGGYTPTGDVTFNLYPPTDATCSGAASYTYTDSTAPYAAPGFASDAVGTWHWTATYAGDANNNSATSSCASEPVVVTKVSPTLSTTPGAGGVVGAVTLQDTGTLSGGYAPTGDVTFRLYPPSDATCSGAASYTETDASAPYATTTGFLADAVGTWHWTATYAGDANNNSATSSCASEPVVVTKASPTLSTTPGAGGALGVVTLQDTGTLSGGYAPTGDVTFRLYPPSDATCSGAASYTETDASAPYATTTGFLADAVGTWHWTATYAGDANNNIATSTCASEPVTVVAPDLTATKTNNVGGSLVLGGSYTWQIVVNNSGTSTATFPNGAHILQDDVPSGPTYGAITATPAGGTAGPVACIWFDADTILCYASGGSVTIPSGGSITLSFSVTPTSAGSLVNPNGVCRVDTISAVAESNEGNNNCSNTVTVLPQPNLTAVKTNNVSGSLVLGGSYDWSIQVSNAAGTSTATFADGQTILTDNLPGGPSYSLVDLVSSGVGGTGGIACMLGSNTLTCYASGGTVTIPAGASFTIVFNVIPVASGSLVNPTGGICRVDPNTLISETNEGDNDCSNTVTVNKASPTLSTTPSAGGVVGVVTLQDTGTLSGGYAPTGDVTFNLYPPSDATCSGAASYTETDALAPYATTTGFLADAVGTWHWTASYSGDANNNAATSSCASEPVVVTKTTPTLSTVPGAGGDIGVTLHDTATLSGGYSPTGDVTFRLYSPSDATCSGAATYTETDATAPYATSTGFVSNAVGTWHWTATYAGDANNNAAVSLCADEPVVVTGASLGDFVWNDLNANGLQDDGATGISGVTVKLFNASTGLQVGSDATTNGSGYYSFTSLVPGDYYVEFTLAAGYDGFSPANVGADDTIDSDAQIVVSPTVMRTATTTLTSGENDLTWDAGMYELASIGNFVWEDMNANGLQDDGATGIDGVTVNLFTDAGVPAGSTNTAGGGYYSFTDLVPGDYYVEFTLAAGYDAFSPANVGGNDAIDSDAQTVVSPTVMRTATTTLVSGENDTTWDAGMYELASLGDFVWSDVNANGLQDDGATGIDGATVNLFTAAGVPAGSTTTAGGGYYSFTDLVPGDYYVEFTLTAGYNSFSPANVGGNDAIDSDAQTVVSPTVMRTATTTLVSGENDLTWDAGMYVSAGLGNFVWNDLNANGLQDDGATGIDGVTVRLFTGAGAPAGSTTTAGGGYYSFTNLVPGDYYVEFTLAAGYDVFSPANAGADDTIDSDGQIVVSPTIMRTATTTLVSGENDLTWDQGMYQYASIGDLVWDDLNSNGLQDDGATGLDGVTVELYDCSGGLVDSMTTAGGGLYAFNNLTPGNYNIQFSLITGYSAFSPANVGGDDTIDSDANTSSGAAACTTLIAGENDTNWDAGLIADNPIIGVAKNATSVTKVSAGTWDVTFDILVRNYGNVALTALQVTDNLDATFLTATTSTTYTVQSVTSADFTVNSLAYDGSTNTDLLTAVDTLAVGGEGTITLVVRIIPDHGSYLNTAIASGLPPSGPRVTDDSHDGVNPAPSGDPTNDNDPTPVTFSANIFDPPFGVKTLDANNLPVLHWTMVWINDTNLVGVHAQVADEIPVGTQYVDLTIACTPASTLTTTDTCFYEAPSGTYPRGRVIWTGTIGPDFGATDADTAVNELYITFDVTVDAGITSVENEATIDSDLNGDEDSTDPGERIVAQAAASWRAIVASAIPETGFAPDRVTVLPSQTVPYADLGDLWLEIPKLGVKMSIVGVPQSNDGQWDVSWLGQDAGWLNGTAYPTWSGNSVLTGHVWNADNSAGPFRYINTLWYGDEIIIHAGGGEYVYQVRSVQQVGPGNTAALLKHEDLPWVTLLTCRGYDEATGSYKYRVLVRAILVEKK